jgi:hypothetical protein
MRKTILLDKGHLQIRLHGILCPDVIIEKTESSGGGWQPSKIIWANNGSTSVDHASEMLHMLRSAVTVAREWDEVAPKLFRLEMSKGGEKSPDKLVNAYLKEHAVKYFEDVMEPDGYVLLSVFEI